MNNNFIQLRQKVSNQLITHVKSSSSEKVHIFWCLAVCVQAAGAALNAAQRVWKEMMAHAGEKEELSVLRKPIN